MVALSSAVLVGTSIVACLFMAWVLGANSNSPPFAPAIGANAISTMQAAFVIGLLAAAGALMQGGSISEEQIGRVRSGPSRSFVAALEDAALAERRVQRGHDRQQGDRGVEDVGEGLVLPRAAQRGDEDAIGIGHRCAFGRHVHRSIAAGSAAARVVPGSVGGTLENGGRGNGRRSRLRGRLGPVRGR